MNTRFWRQFVAIFSTLLIMTGMMSQSMILAYAEGGDNAGKSNQDDNGGQGDHGFGFGADFKAHVKADLVPTQNDPQINQPLHFFVRWGFINKHGENTDSFAWKGTVKIDHGSMAINKTMLLEQGDSIKLEPPTAPETSSNIVDVDTHTTTHWDGTILAVTPSQLENNMLTVNLNNYSKSYTMGDLYKAHDLVDLSDGHQVEILSLNQLNFLKQEAREDFFSRKLKVLNLFMGLDAYVKTLVDGEKTTAQQDAKFMALLNEFIRLNYTDKMEVMVEDAFKLWNPQIDIKTLTIDQILTGMQDLLKNLKDSKEKFNEGVTPFCDVDDNDWFADDVRFLKLNKIISGDAGRCTFRPADDVSRAEFLKMTINAAGEESLMVNLPASIFADSMKHWAKTYIAFALQHQLVQGENGKFFPNRDVTRAEAVKILLKVLNLDSKVDANAGAAFSDTSGHWANAFIAYAKSIGIIQGNPDGTFHPDTPLTRAEAATMIHAAVLYAQSHQ